MHQMHITPGPHCIGSLELDMTPHQNSLDDEEDSHAFECVKTI